MTITKTSRILSIFHLFQYCEEVSYKEITDLIPVSEKTIYRDIFTLKQAGVIQVKFSKKLNAFVPISKDFTDPQFPESKSAQLYLEKLIRLCTLMREMDTEAPVEWYESHYPKLSKRTRQRDFAELSKIGYEIRYDTEGFDREPFQYYCDFPYDTYSLYTFEYKNF